jgi:hypothetical protein
MAESRNLWMILALGALLPADAAENPPPARQLPRDVAIAPPERIPDAAVVSPLPAGIPVPSAEVPRAVRRAVVADAARRFGVAESAVVLTGAEQVTWSDGSLGCPQPGGIYTQNLVPGYLIVAKTTEGNLAYHTDTRGLVMSCGDAGRPTHARKLSEKTPVRGVEPRTQAPPKPQR